MSGARHRPDALARKAHADGDAVLWECGEIAVVEPGASPEPTTVGIKGETWYQDTDEFLWVDDLHLARFENAMRIRSERMVIQ